MLTVEALEVAYGKIQALWGVTFEIPFSAWIEP